MQTMEGRIILQLGSFARTNPRQINDSGLRIALKSGGAARQKPGRARKWRYNARTCAVLGAPTDALI